MATFALGVCCFCVASDCGQNESSLSCASLFWFASRDTCDGDGVKRGGDLSLVNSPNTAAYVSRCPVGLTAQRPNPTRVRHDTRVCALECYKIVLDSHTKMNFERNMYMYCFVFALGGELLVRGAYVRIRAASDRDRDTGEMNAKA